MKRILISILLILMILTSGLVLTELPEDRKDEQTGMACMIVVFSIILWRTLRRKNAKPPRKAKGKPSRKPRKDDARSGQKSAPAPAAAPTPAPARTPTPAPEPTPEPKTETPATQALNTKRVKLAGTASVKARQGYLRKIDEMEEPFDACTYGIEQKEYKGEPAFAVYADLYDGTQKVLGMVPATRVQEVLRIYDRIVDVDVDVYGGPEYEGDDKFYGASATLYYK